MTYKLLQRDERTTEAGVVQIKVVYLKLKSDIKKINTSTSLSAFKQLLLSYHFTDLNNTFNIDDPRTFKTVCRKCHTARRL